MGLSKTGFVGLILTESLCFVFPSIVAGFIASMPILSYIYSVIFTAEMGFTPSIVPGFGASLQALSIAILIPCVSAIIPIKRTLKLSLTQALDT